MITADLLTITDQAVLIVGGLLFAGLLVFGWWLSRRLIRQIIAAFKKEQKSRSDSQREGGR